MCSECGAEFILNNDSRSKLSLVLRVMIRILAGAFAYLMFRFFFLRPSNSLLADPRTIIVVGTVLLALIGVYISVKWSGIIKAKSFKVK